MVRLKREFENLLKNQVILSGSSITSATTGIGQDGRPTVNITVGGDGVSYFNKMTAEKVGFTAPFVYHPLISGYSKNLK